MTTYARIEHDTTLEIFALPEGLTLDECFHADVVALFSAVPDGTEVGAKLNNGEWINPVVVDPPRDSGGELIAYPTLTPMQFYLSFTTTERMLLKALATTGIPQGSALVTPAPAHDIPVDAAIAEFWQTYQMAVDAKASIDPNLPSIKEALVYLASPIAPTPPVLDAARIEQILAGIAQ